MNASLLLPLSLLLLPACNNKPEPADLGQGGYTLARFSDCGELKTWVAGAWTEELVRSRYGYGWGYAVEDGATSGSGTASPTEYSETNVQESGVDEPDLVKTDGSYLYVTHGSSFSVVKSWPAEDTSVLSTLDLDGTPFALFLQGDRAAVMATVWGYGGDGSSGGGGGGTVPDSSTEESGWESGYYEGSGVAPDWAGDSDRYYTSSTRISVIDLSDRSAPQVLREIDLEGYYTDARMIDGDIYVVTNTYSSMPQSLWDLSWSDTLGLPVLADGDWDDQAAVTAAADEARALLYPYVLTTVLGMSAEELLPEVRDQVPGEDAAPVLLTECTDVYHPDGLSSPSSLAVTHFKLDEGDAGSDVSATGLLSDGWEIYASADSLYVTQTSWWWWWGWGDLDLKTHVHKFQLDGADTVYVGSGSVDGWLLNSYSMSEQDGYLRVATTDINWWWGDVSGTGTTAAEPANNVFVLQEDAGALTEVGELRGIAPNEQIYAARFMGDVGYLVTYQQTDPLFTLDLSDPTAPAVVGELEVNGYSSYLHPAGDGYLLAVGMDGDSDGSILGFQVSLFDISDPAAPTLADRLALESDDWSSSEALWDPHAFTYFADTLSLPIYTSVDGVSFSGLWVLDVDLDGGTLSELGRVDHSEMAGLSTCPDDPYDDCYDTGDYAWMRRSVVIEDWLYSLSSYGIKVTELRDPAAEVASVLWYPAG
ncbi:MAG: hypothetical protein GXP62_21405 [Oligoflexia bacterium]|nr:hypothetical protein [Oligoflexia bacterium]